MSLSDGLKKGEIEPAPIPNHESKWCIVIKFDARKEAQFVLDELLLLSQEKSDDEP